MNFKPVGNDLKPYILVNWKNLKEMGEFLDIKCSQIQPRRNEQVDTKHTTIMK